MSHLHLQELNFLGNSTDQQHCYSVWQPRRRIVNIKAAENPALTTSPTLCGNSSQYPCELLLPQPCTHDDTVTPTSTNSWLQKQKVKTDREITRTVAGSAMVLYTSLMLLFLHCAYKIVTKSDDGNVTVSPCIYWNKIHSFLSSPPPKKSSIFRKMPVERMSNFVHNYMVTPIFSDEELEKKKFNIIFW
jgi:hypothetical protein